MIEKLKIKAIYDDFVSKVNLNEEQKRILNMMLSRDKIVKMSLEIGVSEETDKSFHYMVKSLEDFIRVLHEEAETPQQKQMLNETLQRSMM